MKENLKTQNGRSMIEMLGVLAVIGVISAGGFTMVDKMQTSYEDSRVMDDFSTISQKVHPVIREYYGDGNDFGTYIVNAFEKSSITFTGDGVTASTIGQSGKTFTVARTGISTYTVTVSGLSESSCMQVATTRWERMQSLKINDSAKDATSSAAAFAATNCGDDSSITIEFN